MRTNGSQKRKMNYFLIQNEVIGYEIQEDIKKCICSPQCKISEGLQVHKSSKHGIEKVNPFKNKASFTSVFDGGCHIHGVYKQLNLRKYWKSKSILQLKAFTCFFNGGTLSIVIVLKKQDIFFCCSFFEKGLFLGH